MGEILTWIGECEFWFPFHSFSFLGDKNHSQTLLDLHVDEFQILNWWAPLLSEFWWASVTQNIEDVLFTFGLIKIFFLSGIDQFNFNL